MKLRNKKTGEIIDVYKGQILLHYNQGKKTIQFKSIEELEEWEDYEEPKEYWYLDYNGTICNSSEDPVSPMFMIKEIGNYFSLQEEAEKAVEKLEAWKRLKDKGFRFYDYIFLCNDGEPHYIEIKASIDDISDPASKYARDLRLLFGGEK